MAKLDEAISELRTMLTQGHLFTQLSKQEIDGILKGRAINMLNAAQRVYTSITGHQVNTPRGAM